MFVSIKSYIEIRLRLRTTKAQERIGRVSSLIINVKTMKNKVSTKPSNQNDDYLMRSQAEMQRRFVDLQFKRSELEKQLKIVNEVLFSLGREMEQHFSYNQLYK